MRRLRPHLTYANIMVTLLAIGALTGGVAYAANTIDSADIINGQVKSPDIGSNQVQSVDVRDGAWTATTSPPVPSGRTSSISRASGGSSWRSARSRSSRIQLRPSRPTTRTRSRS